MERARHRKSKSASGIEGIQQIQKAVSRFSTDSRSYIDGSKREDLLMLELGQSSWRTGSAGIPVKKLLGEEISKGIEPKRRSPSVVARLMGLESLPSPRHVHGQQKRVSSDGYQQKNASTNVKSKSQRYDGPTSRSPMDHPEFKDVYEDLEASRLVNCRWSSRLTAKHSHDQQLDPANTHIAVLKPSNRDISSKSHVTSNLKRKDGLLLESDDRQTFHFSRSSSRTQLEPTRIVILKPNLGKIQNASTFSSIQSSNRTSFEKLKEYPRITETRQDSSSDLGLSKRLSREAREIAKEITTRMRDAHDDNMVGYRGYVGDESSYDASESDSDVLGLFRRKSFVDKNAQKSSVNREARKQLSERWKMTHECQDLVVSKGSTLGEMLALPNNRKTRPTILNEKTNLGKESDYRHASSNRTVTRDGPLGGKCRGHRRRSTNRDDLAGDKNPMRDETIRCSRTTKFVKRKSSHKEDYLSKYSKSRDMFVDEIDSSSDVNFEIQMEASVKDLSEQHPVFADTCKSTVVDVMITEPGITTLPSGSSELTQKHSFSVIDGGDERAVQEQEDCSFQKLHKVPSKQARPSLPCLGSELHFLESVKEVDQLSPLSVLEVPFTEDTSSCESFERVSAELHELRLQLRLLKMESSTDADVSALFPIGEKDMQPYPVVSEGNYVLGWEFFYALEVLITSGIQDSDFNVFITSWFSIDCPLDPNLFDYIEKKYSHDDETTWTRSERRFLFDRVNSALLRIFADHFDPCPWIMPRLTGLNSKWQNRCVRDAVEKLTEQEISDKVVDRDMQWSSDCKGEVETIGNEIEELLIDDMIAEVLCNVTDH